LTPDARYRYFFELDQKGNLSMRLRSLILVVLAIASIRCGSGGSDNSTPTAPVAAPTTPPAPAPVVVPGRTVYNNISFTNLAVGQGLRKDVDNIPSGKVDGVLDWLADSDLNLYVTTPACPGIPEVVSGACERLALSDGRSRPESLTFDNPTTRTWTFWIYNKGPAAVSGTLEVGVVPSATSAVPTATPTKSPSQDPRDFLPDGPIVTMTAKLRPVDLCQGCNDFRDPFQENGRWILFEGEWVVFDADQRNSNGEKCKWDKLPEWDLDDPNDVLYIRQSSEPFLFRANVVHEGIITVWVTEDGVKSNILFVEVRKGPRPRSPLSAAR
jgi:hypothetical protein